MTLESRGWASEFGWMKTRDLKGESHEWSDGSFDDFQPFWQKGRVQGGSDVLSIVVGPQRISHFDQVLITSHQVRARGILPVD